MTSAALIELDHTAVTVGSTATFICTCTTESLEPPLAWSFAAVGRYEKQYLNCEHSSMAPKCDITLHNNNRTSLLAINDVQLTDAGQYKCWACWNEPMAKAVSNLSVVGKKRTFVHMFEHSVHVSSCNIYVS